VALARLAIGLDPVHALLGEQTRRAGQQLDRVEQVPREQRHEDVQLEMALHPTDRDRPVVPDHLRGDLRHDLGDHRVHLAGHDRAALLQLGQHDLGQTRTMARRGPGQALSAGPAGGPEPMKRMSFAIFVSETASTLSAPEASTIPSRAACDSNGSAGGEISRAGVSCSRARTREANSGCVFRPVPTAVPPSGTLPSRGSVSRTRAALSRICAAQPPNSWPRVTGTASIQCVRPDLTTSSNSFALASSD